MEFIAYDNVTKNWADPENFVIDLKGNMYHLGLLTDTDKETACVNYRYDTYPYINRTDKDGDKIYEGSVLSFGEGVHNSAVVLFDSLGWCVRFRGNDPVLLRTYIKDGHVDAKIVGHIAEDNNVQP